MVAQQKIESPMTKTGAQFSEALLEGCLVAVKELTFAIRLLSETVQVFQAASGTGSGQCEGCRSSGGNLRRDIHSVSAATAQ